MKKRLVMCIAVLGVAACGERSAIEAAIKDRAYDPQSAQFKDLVVSKSGYHACIVWNAKNRMGGYGPWKVAKLEKSDGIWEIKAADMPEDRVSDCSQSNLDTYVSTNDLLRLMEEKNELIRKLDKR